MPRPKRPKLIHTVPTKIRVAESTAISKAQPQKNKPSPQSSARRTNGSDDSDGLVRRIKDGSKGRVGDSLEYMMSGALGDGPIGTTRSRLPSGRTRTQFSRPAREADHARNVGEEKARRSKAQSTLPTELSQIPSSQPLFQPQMSSQRAGRLGPPTANSSNRSSLGSKLQGTPLAQSSMLGGIQFKKRVRQPSLLQLAQAQHDATENFEYEDLDDFRPDDESTPLVKSLSQSHDQHTSSSRKRKLSTPEVQVPASQSQSQSQSQLLPSSPPSDLTPSIRAADSFDVPPDENEDHSEPALPRLRKPATPPLQIFDDTLAPPQSSSSPTKPSPRATNPKRTKASIKAKPSTRNQRSRTSPGPSPKSTTTASKPSPARKAHPPPKPLTTASLQNLLPRRRARPKPHGTYDIPSSSDVELEIADLGEDEDELSYHATSKLRRKKASAGTHKRGTTKSGKGDPGQTSKGKRVSMTYGRKSNIGSHSGSDDGSADEDEDTSREVAGARGATAPVLDGKAKVEMRRLVDKFKEVDEYTLDFEDMTGSSSQMKDAR